MAWSDEYTGIPFRADGRTRDGLDCWGLVVTVYRERLGIALPEFPGAYPDESQESLRHAAGVARAERERWRRVDAPAEGDVVLLRLQGLPCHVGVVISKTEMLHVMAGIESCVEKFTGPQWRNRIEGYYRYAG